MSELMTRSHPTGRMLASVLLLGALGACSAFGHPHRGDTPVTVQAAKDVNPDNQGRPAPIVTRIYQLTSRDKFMVADPIQLIQADTQTLGNDVVARSEYVMRPGDKHEITVPKDEKIKFVGIVAAYRAIDQDDWREIVPLPDDKDQKIDVTVGATGLKVTPSDNK